MDGGSVFNQKILYFSQYINGFDTLFGKNAAAASDKSGDSKFSHPVPGCPGIKTSQRFIQESRRSIFSDSFLFREVIGNIETPFSGNEHFLARALSLFINVYLMGGTQTTGGPKPGHPAADNMDSLSWHDQNEKEALNLVN